MAASAFRKNLPVFPEAGKETEEIETESSSPVSSLEDRPLSSYKDIIYEDNSDQDEDEEHDSDYKALQIPSKSKKKGRKSSWNEVQVDDMVDVICSNEYFKRKLIFTNTKNGKNAQVYESVRKEVLDRLKPQEDTFPFNAIQMRTKFKRCIAECKKVALTVKTATGIKNFLEEKEYGKWFNQLICIGKSRDSCNPDMAVEPSAKIQKRKKSNGAEDNSDVDSNTMDSSNDSIDGITDKSLFVPVKKSRNKKSDPVQDAVSLIKDIVTKDPTADLLSFFKEENERARAHEMQMMQMLMNYAPNHNQPQHPMQFSPPPPMMSGHHNGYMSNHASSSADLPFMSNPYLHQADQHWQ